MSINYSEQLFQSMDTLISQRLHEVQFDKTEICEIIGVDKDNENKYLVSNGSLKYDAYCIDEQRKYGKGLRVYVTIPNGDYTQQKIIIGSCNLDTAPENLYANPFEKLIISSTIDYNEPLIIRTHQATTGEMSEDEALINVAFSYKNTTDFDYIGLEFSLDTFALRGTYKGQYAIEIQLLDEEENKILDSSPLILFNTDLYGNPYSFVPSLKFQHLFPFPKQQIEDSIGTILNIKKIRLIFSEQGGFEKEVEIKLTSFKLFFGYDISTVTTDTLDLILSPEQDLKYTTGIAIDKTVYLDWKHQSPTGDIIVYHKDQLPMDFEEYEIYWLHYIDGIGENPNENIPKDLGWNWETVSSNQSFEQNLSLLTAYNNDQYKVVVRYKYKDDENYSYAISNSLVFQNTEAAPISGAISGIGETLKLKLAEGDTGVYNYYGLDSRLTDSSLRSKKHIITFEFFDGITFDWVKKVKWIFPSSNTMIVDGAPNAEFEVTTETELETLNQASFYINSMYTPGAMNNRIFCEVLLKTGEIRKGSLTLQFGNASVSGSNYAFNIDFEGHRTCMYAKNNTGEQADEITIISTFTKQNGDVMTPPIIEWSWKDNDMETNMESNTGITIHTFEGTTTKVKLIYNKTTVSEENYSILQATIHDYALDNGQTADLIAYLPIPIAKKGYSYISGATRVVYDANGNTASYSKESYGLYDLDKEIKGIAWKINSGEKNNDGIYISDHLQLKESIIYDENQEPTSERRYTLLPLSYIPSITPKTCVYCISLTTNEVLWSQPILIMQNRWEYNLLNSWNGKLQSDDETYILSPLLGAGKKEDNEFSGVIMGDLSVAGSNQVTHTGLYGFEKGMRRFSFNEKGEAYIGDGTNYIDFYGNDGNKTLAIKAENFVLNSGRLEINSNTGFSIYADDVRNEDTEKKIFLSRNGTAIIGGWSVEKASLAYNLNEDYYTCTTSNTTSDINKQYDYADIAISKSGNILLPWDGTTNKYSYIDQGVTKQTGGVRVATKIGNNFGVTTSGKLYTKDIRVIGGSIEIADSSNTTTFKVTSSGKLTAKGVDIDGTLKLNASSTINGNEVTKYATLEATRTNIFAEVVKQEGDATTGVGWSLKSTGFYIYSKNNGAKTEVMKVTNSGLTINGSGTFSGDISAASGTFKGGLYIDSTNYWNYSTYGTKIAGWKFNTNSITNGDTTLSADGNGTITTSNIVIKNGKIRIAKDSGWISQGYGTTHLSVSGLNTRDGIYFWPLMTESNGTVTASTGYGRIYGRTTTDYDWLQIASRHASSTSGDKGGICLWIPDTVNKTDISEQRRIELAQQSLTLRQDFGDINFNPGANNIKIWDSQIASYREGRSGVMVGSSLNEWFLFVHGLLVNRTTNADTARGWSNLWGEI